MFSLYWFIHIIVGNGAPFIKAISTCQLWCNTCRLSPTFWIIFWTFCLNHRGERRAAWVASSMFVQTRFVMTLKCIIKLYFLCKPGSWWHYNDIKSSYACANQVCDIKMTLSHHNMFVQTRFWMTLQQCLTSYNDIPFLRTLSSTSKIISGLLFAIHWICFLYLQTGSELHTACYINDKGDKASFFSNSVILVCKFYFIFCILCPTFVFCTLLTLSMTWVTRWASSQIPNIFKYSYYSQYS